MNKNQLEKKLYKIAESLSAKDKKILLKAYELAEKVHKHQKRKSGAPFIVHPLAVAINLWEQFKDVDLTIAGLLHDTIEDGGKAYEKEIYENFGKEIGFMVDALNKRSKGFYKKRKKFTDRTKRFLWAGLQNPYIFLLKIADREQNLLDVENLPSNKQVRISFETQAIYEPLRKILNYEECNDTNIVKLKKDLNKFIKSHNLKDIKALKNYLISEYYKGFTTETFNEVYKNSDKIIWETNDMDEFAKLCKNKQFDESVTIVSMQSEESKRSVLFHFKLAHVGDKKIKELKIKSFKS